MFVKRKTYQAALDEASTERARADYWQSRFDTVHKDNAELVKLVRQKKDRINELWNERNEAVQAQTDLADKHNLLLARVEADKTKRSDAVARGNITRRLKRLAAA